MAEVWYNFSRMMKEVENTRLRVRKGENLNKPYGGDVSKAPFPQTLHHLAVSRGFESQRALAKALGVSQKNVSRWYRGQNIPSPEAFGKLLILFNPNDEEKEPLVELYAKRRDEQKMKHSLEAEGKTKFSITIHEQEQEICEQEIGEDEKSMWQYAVRHELLPIILKSGIITEQELESIKDYFEHTRIGQNLNEEIFNKFTIAVANVA